MTTVLPFQARAPSDALAIRSAVAATRRFCPQADVENLAEYAIAHAVPVGAVKAICFDQIAAAVASRPGETTFRRAPFAAVIGSERRRA